MKMPFLKLTLVALVAGFASVSRAQQPAQTTNGPAIEKKAPHEAGETTKKKPAGMPFHGKLVAVDKTAKTITVGKRTFQITSQTRMRKADKPAVLDDAVVGEEVSGYIKPAEDGKLIAATVTFGPKTETKTTEKKQHAPAKEAKPEN